jgi:DNA-binding MurR/RpiR family transcriptional regulator
LEQNVELDDQKQLSKFIDKMAKAYNIKKIKRGHSSILVQDLSSALTHTKLLNFLETENIEPHQFNGGTN